MSRKSPALPSVVLVHPTGNANVRQAAQTLSDAGLLGGFHTTIAWRQGSFLSRLLPGSVKSELARRSYPGLPADLVHSHPWHEILRMIALRGKLRSLTRHETGAFSLDAICAALDRAVARDVERSQTAPSVYAYDDCALNSFRAARKRGGYCFYELPIGYLRRWKAIRDEEIEREPLWGRTLAAGIDSEAKLTRKDAEIAAADQVIVPSKFVADSLAGSPARKIAIVPYGCPAPAAANLRGKRKPGPLRVLYVGSVGQRKGISYLLRAMELLGTQAELSLVGRCAHPSDELVAQLNRHRWTHSLPHDKVLEAMRNQDVLVLPTLFEGRALVVLEALSQGLPVITTLNSGTEDVVRDGESGFIVPIRSAEAIAAALTRLADNPGLLAEMSTAAQRIAGGWSWKNYRERLLDVVTGCLDTHSGN